METNTGLKEPLIKNDASLEAEIAELRRDTYLNVSFLNRLFFKWMEKFLHVAKQKPFQQSMHANLRDSEACMGNFVRAHHNWEEYKGKKFPLLRAVIQNIKSLLVTGLFFTISARLVALSGPYIMSQTIQYVQSPEVDNTKAFALVAMIGLTKVGSSLLSTQSSFTFKIAGSKAYNTVNSLIYDKALKFSVIRSNDHSLGKLMNYMQVDSAKLMPLSDQFAAVVSVPIQIVTAIWLMYQFIGVSSVAGVIVLIIVSGSNYYLSKRMVRMQKQVMQKRDERMKFTNEIVNGIKFIKMSGWEEIFLQKGQAKRLDELSMTRKIVRNHLLRIFVNWVGPMMITVSVFTTYILLGNTLTAEIAFPIVSVFLMLQFPLRAIPQQINNMIETFVGINRIQKFLLEDEVDMKYIKRNDIFNPDVAIKIENGNFYWVEPDQLKDKKKEKKQKSAKRPQNGEVVLEMAPLRRPSEQSIVSSEGSSIVEEGKPVYTLKNINMQIKKGAFVAIIGDIGCGKSSLFYSLLGEMKYHDFNMPQVTINGETAYISQRPWIINETLKKNVLFGLPFDEQKYREAVKYSCLESDLKILPHGDETEIGEKGVNLSGGQKARVALAQAIYADKDIYLLDDPLSAVDVHVGTYIIQECLSDYLKNKTRVLITHNLDYLKYVDHVYIMKRGRIVGEGTYEEILNHAYYKRLEKIHRKGTQSPTKITTTSSPEKSPASGKSQSRGKKEAKSPEEAKVGGGGGGRRGGGGGGRGGKASGTAKEIEEDPSLKRLMLDEDRQTGKLQTNVYRAFYNFYGGLKFVVTLALSMLLWLILSLSSNFYLSHWTAGPHTGDASEELRSLRIYSFLALSYGIFNVARSATVFNKSIHCSETIHYDMLKSVIRAPINHFFDRVPLGRILNRFSKDLNVVDTQIGFSTMRFAQFFFVAIGDMIVCVYGGTYFIIPLVVLFFYFAYQAQLTYQALNREVSRLESISRSPILSHFSESISGLTVIRSYHAQERFFNNQLRQQDENMKNHILKSALANWFSLRTSLLSLVLILPCIAVCVVFKGVLATSGGLVGLVITYSLSCDDDIRASLAAHAELQTHLISIERCLAFIHITPEAPNFTENPKAITNYSNNWPTQGQIEFVDYSVRYRPSLPLVLKNVSFRINGGEKIGVVGRTGSGKSTIILSILRIIEAAEGKILIDGADISKIGLHDLRNAVTCIPQDPMLFNGTLRENIDILKEFTNEQIWEVMQKVSLSEKIETKEGGLDMLVKEDGGNLSAGEKQLICIARAMLRKNKIILIDEATSNIDIETEALIQSTIKEKLKDSTVFTIAHRLNTIIESDRILVMGDGHVLEFDTPQKLLANENSYFYGLWQQASKENFVVD